MQTWSDIQAGAVNAIQASAIVAPDPPKLLGSPVHQYVLLSGMGVLSFQKKLNIILFKERPPIYVKFNFF